MIPSTLLTRAERPAPHAVAVARATTRRGTAPVDLALVATAAADAWCSGAGLPPPRAYLAERIVRACRKVGARHHLFVDGTYHARAKAALDRVADAINALAPELRAPVLCVALMDLLNDRAEVEFTALSAELARLDREYPREGTEVEHEASRIAEAVREEMR